MKEKSPTSTMGKRLEGLEGLYFWISKDIVQLNIDFYNRKFKPSPLNIEKAVGK
jgi:hypothetical protein